MTLIKIKKLSRSKSTNINFIPSYFYYQVNDLIKENGKNNKKNKQWKYYRIR